jgi:preprotein translocase subunit YajC
VNILSVAFAAADSSAANSSASPMANYTFYILIAATFAIMYFFMIRPQKKKEKERQNLIASIQKGDKVLTVGGMYGIVDELKGNDIIVIKVSGNTKIEFTRNSVQTKITQ